MGQREQSDFAVALASIQRLLTDGEWRTASTVWRESGIERRWVTLTLRLMRERGEVELREATTPAGQITHEYRLVRRT